MAKNKACHILLEFLWILVLLFSTEILRCQTNTIDSLKNVLKNSKEDTGKVNTLYQLGFAYYLEDNYPESLENSYEALKIAEFYADKSKMLSLRKFIGVIYFFQENYNESLNNYFEALKLAKENGAGEYALADLYINIADSYQKVNKQEALNTYNQALLILSKLKPDAMQQGRAYNGIAEVYEMTGDSLLKAGKKEKAIAKYNDAIAKLELAVEFRKISCDACVSESLMNLGSLMIKLENYKGAKSYLDQGLKKALSTRKTHIAMRAYDALSKLDSAQGDYKAAFEHYKKYIIYRDSLTSIEESRKAVQTKQQYEFDKKEDALKQQYALTQSRLESQRKQKNLYIAGAALFFLLSVFVFLNFRNQKRINRLIGDAHAKEKAELELQSLRAQLNPHFMFNSLNAIQELILKEENEKSQSYLARFAKLLRMLLENADRPFIPLQKEIDFLQLYLSLENLRIPDLQFSIDIDKTIDTENTMIPNMILQPYIENAIWHGLSHKENNKRLQIRISNKNGFTKYEIEDNGVGRKKAAELKSLYRKEHKSKGMELLSKRFKLLAKEYGSEVKTLFTDIETGLQTGTIVTITVPDNFKPNSNYTS